MTTIFETTDAASDTSTTYAMLAGDVFIGNLSQNALDWIAVTLVAGHSYSFGAVGLGAVGSGVTDPVLKLYSANGSVVLAQNDDGGPGYCADMTFTATSSGTFFIEVKSLSGAIDGDYGLVVTEGDRPAYGAELGAAVIYRDGDSWAATPATPVVLSWGVRQSGPAVDASGFSAPFSVLTAAQIAATEGALAAFADVGNVTFTQVAPGGTTDSATILVGAYTSSSDGAGAYAWYPGSTADASADGDMWINNFWANTSDIPIGSYDYYIYLHELGHSMGLAHPGDYNAGGGGPITYQTSAQFVQDSQQYSVMSYFLATDTEPGAPTSYADTLMMYDIYALQELYGVNSATRSGNDTYGFHATLGGAYDFTVNLDPLLCIWDGAGRDTLNLSGFGGRQIINLNDGTLSNVGGYTGNLSIAVGASIENAVGGLGRDQIIGNELGNLLRGGRGIDILIGAGGNDRLSGNLGADRFVFADGCDRDRITDFNKTADRLGLSSDLWGGGVMTAAEVLAAFGTINAGNLVLNFGGGDVVTLLHVSSLVGMADSILIT